MNEPKKIIELLKSKGINISDQVVEEKVYCNIYGLYYIEGAAQITWGNLHTSYKDNLVEIWPWQRMFQAGLKLNPISAAISTVFNGACPNHPLITIVKEEGEYKFYVLNGHQRLHGIYNWMGKNIELPDDDNFNNNYSIDDKNDKKLSIGGYTKDRIIEEVGFDWLSDNVLNRKVIFDYIILEGDEWTKDKIVHKMIHYFVTSNEALKEEHKLSALSTNKFIQYLNENNRIGYPKHSYDDVRDAISDFSDYDKSVTKIANHIIKNKNGNITDPDYEKFSQRKNLDHILSKFLLTYLLKEVSNNPSNIGDLLNKYGVKKVRSATIYKSLRDELKNSVFYKPMYDEELIKEFDEKLEVKINQLYVVLKEKFSSFYKDKLNLKNGEKDSHTWIGNVFSNANAKLHIEIIFLIRELSETHYSDFITNYIDIMYSTYFVFSKEQFNKIKSNKIIEIFNDKIERLKTINGEKLTEEQKNHGYESEVGKLVAQSDTLRIIKFLLKKNVLGDTKKCNSVLSMIEYIDEEITHTNNE